MSTPGPMPHPLLTPEEADQIIESVLSKLPSMGEQNPLMNHARVEALHKEIVALLEHVKSNPHDLEGKKAYIKRLKEEGKLGVLHTIDLDKWLKIYPNKTQVMEVLLEVLKEASLQRLIVSTSGNTEDQIESLATFIKELGRLQKLLDLKIDCGSANLEQTKKLILSTQELPLLLKLNISVSNDISFDVMASLAPIISPLPHLQVQVFSYNFGPGQFEQLNLLYNQVPEKFDRLHQHVGRAIASKTTHPAIRALLVEGYISEYPESAKAKARAAINKGMSLILPSEELAAEVLRSWLVEDVIALALQYYHPLEVQFQEMEINPSMLLEDGSIPKPGKLLTPWPRLLELVNSASALTAQMDVTPTSAVVFAFPSAAAAAGSEPAAKRLKRDADSEPQLEVASASVTVEEKDSAVDKKEKKRKR